MITMYFDMDNVLANFDDEKDAVKRFREKGFFRDLKPIEKNLERLMYLYNLGVDIYILSTSPSKRADNDKKAWLKKYLPRIKKDHIIFCRLGQKKVDFIKDITQTNVLIDDYSKNCEEWAENGFISYKVGYLMGDKNSPIWKQYGN